MKDIAVTHYRFLRRTQPPQEALQNLVAHFEVQADMARRSGQTYSESLARDLEQIARRADELVWEVNARRGWATSHQRFWQTGKRDHQRGWVVIGCRSDGENLFISECPDAGCAIKHGLHLFIKPEWKAFIVHQAGDWSQFYPVNRGTSAELMALILGGD